jgi:hypothetical protein
LAIVTYLYQRNIKLYPAKLNKKIYIFIMKDVIFKLDSSLEIPQESRKIINFYDVKIKFIVIIIPKN